MDIERQFNLIAEEYDENRKKFIPCFDAFYQDTTKFITSCIAQPNRILDLGAGTGLLTYFWFQQYPTAEYVLVDVANEMLNVARRRFSGIDTVSYQTLNYSNELPDQTFNVIISALSIHHLEDAEKEKLFAQIYDKLPKGGLFVNYDQFRGEQAEIDRWYSSYWKNQLLSSGLTEHDLTLWEARRELDRECSAEKERGMLCNCGFEIVQCVYSHQKFSVFVAIK